jgi:hypothetical protein
LRLSRAVIPVFVMTGVFVAGSDDAGVIDEGYIGSDDGSGAKKCSSGGERPEGGM